MTSAHISVLVNELKVLLNLKSGDESIDGTLDGGGHAKMMLELVGKGGKVLGIERDLEMIKQLGTSPENLIIAQGSYEDIAEPADKNNFKNVSAVLLDLGISTWHLQKSGRGFSFQKPHEILDMRFDGRGPTAADFVNGAAERELKDVFAKFGEVRGAGRIAKKIVFYRRKKKIATVGNLLEALGKLPPRVLAKLFQALRIEANKELDAVEKGVRNSFTVLKKEGRLAVISYHSLEDRIVKNFYKERAAKEEGKILTKKPITPLADEISQNPSSRSAKLRILEKI